ncbi:MAG: hypothetical protein N7Q72_04380, partial [Spiroplasma sp. Tabriz.8]|nr:hypothetical protein [Spiroplasma sp. Tabriz.8]
LNLWFNQQLIYNLMYIYSKYIVARVNKKHVLFSHVIYIYIYIYMKAGYEVGNAQLLFFFSK